MCRRRHGNAAQHRLQFDGVVCEMFARVLETCHAFFTIEHPIAIEFLAELGALKVARRQRGWNNAVA